MSLTVGPGRRMSLALAGVLMLHLPGLLGPGHSSADSEVPGSARGAGWDAYAIDILLPPIEPLAAGSAPSSAPPVARPALASPSRPLNQGGGGSAGYLSRIRARLERMRRPLTTEVRGTAVVAFLVDARGEVQGLRLERSSGHPELDEEAVSLVRRAAPLPAPPRGRSLPLSVPVLFE